MEIVNITFEEAIDICRKKNTRPSFHERIKRSMGQGFRRRFNVA